MLHQGIFPHHYLFASLVRHSKPSCLFSIWHSESYFHFGVQSHILSFSTRIQHLFSIQHLESSCHTFQFRRSEPSSLLSIGDQSHHRFSVSTFKAIIAFQFRRSESPSLLSFGVQSHHRLSVLAFKAIIAFRFRCSGPSLLLSFGVQIHHRFSILAFKAIITSQFQHSKPPSFLNFGVQNYHRFSLLAFRVIIASQFWRSESLSLLSFGVQSHHRFLVSAFRAIIASQFGVQSHHHFSVSAFMSHHRFSVLAFKAIIASQFRRSESSFTVLRSESSSIFRRSELHLQFDVQSHRLFLVRHSKLSSSLYSRAFRAIVHIQAFRDITSPQFGIQSRHLSSFWRSKSFLLSLIIQSRYPCTVWRSESLSLSQFGVQSYHSIMIGDSSPHFRRLKRHSQHLKPSFTVWILEPSFIPRVQSHHIFNLAFRAISQPIIQSRHFPLVWRSEPHYQHLELSFSFSSVFKATLLVFGIVIFFQFSIQGRFYHSEPFPLVLDVQSHVFSLAFQPPSSSIWRSEPCLCFGIQNHRPTQYSVPPFLFSFGVQSFRVYSFKHLESSSFIILAFRVISPQPCHSESRLLTFIFTGIAHLTFMVLHSSSIFSNLVTLCLSLIHHALLNFPFPCM